ARFVRDEEVAGSNPVIPTNFNPQETAGCCRFTACRREGKRETTRRPYSYRVVPIPYHSLATNERRAPAP
ncbi:hypothetical protein, partial [uncultured Corynebacterium sp.]|uniref:hypothetical protein n=1 Tax=uncultured Corynebacterium sp. TaxID=159447 RepID=UPI0025DBD986